MTNLSMLIRFSCLFSAYAALSSISNDKVTLTILADTDGQGVGFLVKIDGCPDGGCEKNSSALFKIQDDDGNSKYDGNCGEFDDFRDNSDEGTSKNEDFFFIAFQMEKGDQGQYFMSKGCFQEAGAGVETNDGKIWPGDSEWKSLEWTAPQTQFGSQPDFDANKALGANKTDVYIPELLLVTPHSKDAALVYNNAGYRTSQYRYVGSKEKLVLYFSEKVSGVEGKNVYVYEFAPGTLWDATTAAETGQALAAKDFASDEKFFGTKHTGSPTLKENRLYKVLIDAGAFEDTRGNAARGGIPKEYRMKRDSFRKSSNKPFFSKTEWDAMFAE